MIDAKRPTKSLDRLLLEALDKTTDGFCIFDPDDKVVYANRGYASLFSDTPEALIGKTFRQAILQTYASPQGLEIETDDIENWIEYALNKRRQQTFRAFQTDTKEGHWLQLTEQMLDDGHMLVYFTDITAQKDAEQQLEQLAQQLRHHAETDGLTETNNRRHFIKLAAQELERSRRENNPSAILAVDIDHFKRINDNFGHPAGDQVLIELVKVFNQTLRPYDILGRIGGEEFAVFIPGADQAMAKSVSERLRLAVEQHPFSYQQHPVKVTTSIGMIVDDQQQDINTLFKHADQALYQAKDNGRNQVAVYC